MSYVYAGVEMTHNKQAPRSVILMSRRKGKIARWVASQTPTVDNGSLRERLALVLPAGFRFHRDQIRHIMKMVPHYTWSDAKMKILERSAIGVYRPYEKAKAISVPAQIEAAPVQAES